MNEEEPLEKEIAVDPEMLGKIFENLFNVLMSRIMVIFAQQNTS